MKNFCAICLCVLLSIAFIDVYLDNKIMEAALMLNDNKTMPLSGNETFFSEKTIYYPTGEVESITESFSTSDEITAIPPETKTTVSEKNETEETTAPELTTEEQKVNQDVEIPSNGSNVITEKDLLPLPETENENIGKDTETIANISIEPILIDGEIDVETLLSKIEFTEKLFLGKVLIKIGGMETVQQIIKGDENALETVRRKLSIEEQEQLISLFDKYKNYIGNISN